MPTKTFRKKSRNRKSRKYKGGAKPGSPENLRNCKLYWHPTLIGKSKCHTKNALGLEWWEAYNYPGIQNKMNGKLPTSSKGNPLTEY